MAAAADLELPFPEAAIVSENSLEAQSVAIAAELPERPIILGGCCCSHVGAVEGLDARYGRLALVWFDAHGDLNTPESSPSGNSWGMPLRILLDSGAVQIENTALAGARNLDPPEEAYIATAMLGTGEEAIPRALEGTDGVYVAFDLDVLDPGEAAVFMPEPDGLSLADAERVLRSIAGYAPVLGVGLTGHLLDPRNVEVLVRVCRALGL
jgi:arginase